uniref:Uncharacterized protein n=1 Tax=Anguilla anguilla TaxID=7936 RepID=A0A0E9XK65_ANGAN
MKLTSVYMYDLVPGHFFAFVKTFCDFMHLHPFSQK